MLSGEVFVRFPERGAVEDVLAKLRVLARQRGRSFRLGTLRTSPVAQRFEKAALAPLALDRASGVHFPQLLEVDEERGLDVLQQLQIGLLGLDISARKAA